MNVECVILVCEKNEHFLYWNKRKTKQVEDITLDPDFNSRKRLRVFFENW